MTGGRAPRPIQKNDPPPPINWGVISKFWNGMAFRGHAVPAFVRDSNGIKPMRS